MNENVYTPAEIVRLDELAQELETLQAQDAVLWEDARDELRARIGAILDLRETATALVAERAAITGQTVPRCGDVFGLRGTTDGLTQAFIYEATKRYNR